MKYAPTVTVLMAVYNGQSFLQEAVESILNQTFTDFEFLIINDGSTDASKNIILSYNDARIRLIDNERNIGLTRSLNRGLALVRGRYIARQDADDISEPQRLARQVDFMDTNPHIALLGTRCLEIDSAGKVVNEMHLPLTQIELQWALLFYCPFVHSSIMLRTETLVHDIGFYNEKFIYAQDHELWLRASRLKPIANSPYYLVRYRLNPHSMTETYGELTDEGIWLTITEVGSLLGWSRRDETSNKIQFEKMYELLYGYETSLSPAEINQLTAVIWQLQRTFSNSYQLGKADAERHRTKLRAWLSKRYIRIALGYAIRGERSNAWQIYKQGLQLRLPFFFTTKSARLLFALLLVQPMKMLLSFIQRR